MQDTTRPRMIGEEDIIFMLNILHLIDSIVKKYEGDYYYQALQGLLVGLKRFYANYRPDELLDVYLTWYIKTAIEYHLGYENGDTQAWSKKFEGPDGEELIRF